jgi:hypothetical protein
MRWTLKVVNQRVVVFPEGFSSMENNLSKVDNSYEGNNCLIIINIYGYFLLCYYCIVS